jgi:hypothetical protein
MPQSNSWKWQSAPSLNGGMEGRRRGASRLRSCVLTGRAHVIEEGWIDEVDDGIVYGRIIRDGEEVEFWIPLLLIMESQRVDLQPGSYITVRNGEIAVNCTIWTTHDMEEADRQARRWHRALVGREQQP